jgi:predicted S18 family serine protease
MYHSGQEVEDALVEVAEVEEVAPEEEEEEEEVAAALVEAAEVLAEEVEAVLAGEAALAEAEAEAEQGFLPRDAEWKLLIFRRLYF